MSGRIVLLSVAALGAIAAVYAGVAALMWLAWSRVAVAAFHAPALSYWQMLLGMFFLSALCSMLGGIFKPRRA